MAWVKIDDNFPDHPKLLGLGVPGIVLQVRALCYASRHLTDGFLSSKVVAKLTEDFDDYFKADVFACKPEEEMEAAGLWERADGGYVIHDYLEYNPSKRQVLSTRRKRQASGKQGGLRSGQARRKHDASPLLNPRPVPSRPLPGPSRPQEETITPLAPTGGNGLPEWFTEALKKSQYFAALADGHGKFWQAMSAAYDPYEWLHWDEQVQKADAWIAANPQRAPTQRGLTRFLRSWFERAVERQRKEHHAARPQTES